MAAMTNAGSARLITVDDGDDNSITLPTNGETRILLDGSDTTKRVHFAFDADAAAFDGGASGDPFIPPGGVIEVDRDPAHTTIRFTVSTGDPDQDVAILPFIEVNR